MWTFLSGLATIRTAELQPHTTPPGRWSRLIRHPLLRILIAALFLAPVMAVAALLAILVIERLPEPTATWLDHVRMVGLFLLLSFAYRQYCRRIENRSAYELSGHRSLAETGLGVAVGGGLVLLMVGALALGGWYRVTGIGSIVVLFKSILLFGVGAFLQELVFRVILLRLLEELLGSWLAVCVVSLIFGLVHLGNPNATVFSVPTLMLSDVMLSAAFILTRRIWLVWGIHAGWNYFQAGVFGMANSGQSFPSWLQPTIEGPAWLTGGAFGIEASWPMVVANLGLGLLLLRVARHEQQILAPRWQCASD